MRHLVKQTTLFLILLSLAQAAEARSSRREGFNFGTTVRYLSTNDRANADVESETKDVRQTSTTTAINPYLGWVVNDALNLGVVGTMESTESTRSEKSSDGVTTLSREANNRIRGASMFARFLFADVLFFEAGMGIYEQNISVHEETRDRSSAGLFTGNAENYSVNGTGPGYHAGAGLELPVVNDFFFSASYIARVFQMRDFNGGAVSAKKGSLERRELNFGLSYYYR
jgi:hypothetical protein